MRLSPTSAAAREGNEIRAAVAGAEAQGALRDSLTEAVADRIAEERGGEEAGIEVEVVSLYNGGLYSAYVFRRYGAARIVEELVGGRGR